VESAQRLRGYASATPLSRWRSILLVARRALAPHILLPRLAVVAGVALVASPFFATIWRSVVVGPDAAPEISLHNFIALFQDHRFHVALVNTLIVGAGATVFSCLLALGLAWIVARTDAPGRAWFDTLNLVPFFLSPYVGAMSWIALAAPNEGLLNHVISLYLSGPDDVLNIYSLWGVTWVLSLFYTPYVYLFVIGPMRRMDPALEDAARVHGAGFGGTMRYVTAPLLMPSSPLVASQLHVLVPVLR